MPDIDQILVALGVIFWPILLILIVFTKAISL